MSGQHSAEIVTPSCPACGNPLTAAYDDGHPFWECDGCRSDFEPHRVTPPAATEGDR